VKWEWRESLVIYN
ncbi:N-acetyl-D-glucosamine kinase, partial [Haemophilus influenzae]